MFVFTATNMCCNWCSCFLFTEVWIVIEFSPICRIYLFSLRRHAHTSQMVMMIWDTVCWNLTWAAFWTWEGVPEPLTLFASVSPNCSVLYLCWRGAQGWGEVVPRLKRGGRAQLLPGGGISVRLLVLFVLTSRRLVELVLDFQAERWCWAVFVFFSAQTDFSMETIRFVLLLLHIFCDVIIADYF